MSTPGSSSIGKMSTNSSWSPYYDNDGIGAIENNKNVSRNRDELVEEQRTALSPILISKEKLQEIVESKKRIEVQRHKALWEFQII